MSRPDCSNSRAIGSPLRQHLALVLGMAAGFAFLFGLYLGLGL